MNVLRLLVGLCLCGSLGCATGLMEPMVEQSAVRILQAAAPARSPAQNPTAQQSGPTADLSAILASDESTAEAEADDDVELAGADLADAAQADDQPEPGQPDGVRLLQGEMAEPEFVSAPEVIEAPAPVPSRFKPASEDEPENRFDRSLADIAVDIRPPVDNGNEELPPDLAKKRFDEQSEVTIDSSFPTETQVVVGPTPWGFCFRPLYFEEVNLERYGCEHGLLQSGISGTQFFVTFAALPYKMTVRPPRSCVCSNGFSRCGDTPPPNYGRWYWRWDAALVEMAAVTGVVYFLP